MAVPRPCFLVLVRALLLIGDSLSSPKAVFARPAFSLAEEPPLPFELQQRPGHLRDPRRRGIARQIIQDFSSSKGFDVLLLSPLAAGVGLTITAANNVIHYGRWWNPAKEDQATDRAHRIGQLRPVAVYYPLLHHPGDPDGGFDIRLHELVEAKRAIARDFLAPAEDPEFSKELESTLSDREEHQ